MLRYFPKDFRQQRYTAGGWRWGLEGVRRVLYKLPEVVKAECVFIVEGEKDSDLLHEWGMCGTTNPGGAGKWRDSYSETLHRKAVASIPDADEPGRRHARDVAESLLGVAESVKIIELPSAKDLSAWAEVGGDAAELRALEESAEPLTRESLEALRRRWFPDDLQPGKRSRAASTTATLAAEPEPEAGQQWPEPLAAEALHGLAGEIVRTIEPYSEADPAALLVQVLIGFESVVGRAPYFAVEADEHRANLFAVIVGATSTSRKGTSWSHVRRLLAAADEGWATNCITGGLSSGEGLIWAVRNPIEKKERIREKGRVAGYETVLVDEGVSDKRLLVFESEFSRVLRVCARPTNTLSATTRQAWDTGDLRTLTKTSPAVATGAHISIIAHVTSEELRRELDETDMGNGFGNRFLFVCATRSKLLPEGGRPNPTTLDRLAGSTPGSYRSRAQTGGD